ncbi:TetR/AcrR family transcriptional regulator C-terminal domain-containing protein [Lentzea flava]|uniref:TetR family transcriptional regulator n=1 Tax=Lentzea flava TaxID=103732 RepID=A0ABQ2V4S6_9PSEU|nr:TetR/AcrR family transcriptional regulator C-terminal domain-containing protein [Lentzea flava]MCP2203107.1 transcriptional regulator, TetR family [Lentzea flava]GGU66138.1 TetR family transcriptional regulator [Lentzea flava]
MALDATTIVREALALLRHEGLPGVTFRNLTKRLGVKAPAIYWRFENKQQLLEAMAEAILRERFADLAPFSGAEPWQRWLVELLRRLRRALLAYPDGARVVVGARPLETPTLARIAECALHGAEQAGLDVQHAASVVFTALHYTFGHVIEEQDSAEADRMDGEAAERFAREFPTIARVLAGARTAGTTRDDVYDAGLALIIGA